MRLKRPRLVAYYSVSIRQDEFLRARCIHSATAMCRQELWASGQQTASTLSLPLHSQSTRVDCANKKELLLFRVYKIRMNVYRNTIQSDAFDATIFLPVCNQQRPVERKKKSVRRANSVISRKKGVLPVDYAKLPRPLLFRRWRERERNKFESFTVERRESERFFIFSSKKVCPLL